MPITFRGRNADRDCYSPARQRFHAAGGRFPRLEKMMGEIIYISTFIALAYLVCNFWFRVGIWCWRNWKDARRKIEKFKDAAMAAYREGDFGGDAERR
jgi:hypothetical protein